MIEHSDVPEHPNCNPGTNHRQVMYCETRLSKLVAERCDCSEAEGYLCPTHAALYTKEEKYKDLLQGHYSLCCKVAKLEDELKASNLQNRDLQNRVEMLTASLESILKRELGLDFQTYLQAKAAGPLTRVLLDEVIERIGLIDKVNKPDKPDSEASRCSHDYVYSQSLRARMCELCGHVEGTPEKREGDCDHKGKASYLNFCPDCGEDVGVDAEKRKEGS